MLHCLMSESALYKGDETGEQRRTYDEVPNPCCKEYISGCYNHASLCQRESELKHALGQVLGEMGSCPAKKQVLQLQYPTSEVLDCLYRPSVLACLNGVHCSPRLPAPCITLGGHPLDTLSQIQ
jgi:hypothetical protein